MRITDLLKACSVELNGTQWNIKKMVKMNGIVLLEIL